MTEPAKSILDGIWQSQWKQKVLFYLLDELADKQGFDKRTVLALAEVSNSQEQEYPENFDINEVDEPELARFYDEMNYLLMGYINLHETRKQSGNSANSEYGNR